MLRLARVTQRSSARPRCHVALRLVERLNPSASKPYGERAAQASRSSAYRRRRAGRHRRAESVRCRRGRRQDPALRRVLMRWVEPRDLPA
ncbi:hypothetical protein GCM10028799_16190 [Kribbella italica]